MKIDMSQYNVNLKVVHKKKIQTDMIEKGAAAFMEATLDADQVKYFIDAFGEVKLDFSMLLIKLETSFRQEERAHRSSREPHPDDWNWDFLV